MTPSNVSSPRGRGRVGASTARRVTRVSATRSRRFANRRRPARKPQSLPQGLHRMTWLTAQPLWTRTWPPPDPDHAIAAPSVGRAAAQPATIGAIESVTSVVLLFRALPYTNRQNRAGGAEIFLGSSPSVLTSVHKHCSVSDAGGPLLHRGKDHDGTGNGNGDGAGDGDRAARSRRCDDRDQAIRYLRANLRLNIFAREKLALMGRPSRTS